MREPSKLRTSVIDGWTIHRSKNPIGNIGRPGDLQKMPARLATEGITMHSKASGHISSRARSHPDGGGGWPSQRNMVRLHAEKQSDFQEICFALIPCALHMNSPSRYCMQLIRVSKNGSKALWMLTDRFVFVAEMLKQEISSLIFGSTSQSVDDQFMFLHRSHPAILVDLACEVASA